MDLFFHTSAPKALLVLLEKRRMATKELIAASEAGGTWYSSRIGKRLEELDLITTEEIREGRKLTIFHELTPKGEKVARKLSYVFDEEKEVYPIAKTIVEDLQDADLLHAEGVATWQGIIDQAIHEKLVNLKKQYKTKF